MFLYIAASCRALQPVVSDMCRMETEYTQKHHVHLASYYCDPPTDVSVSAQSLPPTQPAAPGAVIRFRYIAGEAYPAASHDILRGC